MIYGNIAVQESIEHLLVHPIWNEAFQWIKAMPANIQPAIYQLRGEHMLVNVHGYPTLPRGDCRFESHRKYVDLQYCIQGGELIDWEQSSSLKCDGNYDAGKDFQFYQGTDSKTVLHMLPGHFAIFFPSDGHRPKCSDAIHPTVFKLVIKIDRALLTR